MKIQREQIIKHLEDSLKNNPSIFAFWLEGSDANGSVDQYSDLDFWLDVADGQESKILEEIENSLSTLGELDFSYQIKHPHPLIKHKIFHIKGTPEFLLLDVCVQSHSRNFEFVRGYDDEPKVLFNRGGMKFRELDQSEFESELKERIHHLKNTFAQQSRVLGKIERGEFLESIMYYNRWVLEPLVELLRIKYIPRKREYFFKHIRRDLPKEVVDQLENLVKTESLEDMKEKIEMASKLFAITLKDLEKTLS